MESHEARKAPHRGFGGFTDIISDDQPWLSKPNPRSFKDTQLLSPMTI